jgi:hypothetical protein
MRATRRRRSTSRRSAGWIAPDEWPHGADRDVEVFEVWPDGDDPA